MNITIDWPTSAAIIGSVVTVAGFLYGVFKKPKEEQEEVRPFIDKNQAEICHSQLQNNIDNLSNSSKAKIEMLSQSIKMLQDDMDRLKKGSLDDLDRIEARLEKMIDLVIRLGTED